MRFCEQCGGQVSDIARFCEQCGAKLRQAETPNDNITPQDSSPDTGRENQAKDSTMPEPEVEELDLTKLDDKVKDEKTTEKQPKKADNIIDLKDILESDEKVEADESIKREALADDEVFYKVCPMCGEEMNLNKQLLENTPVMVKCLKCGNETKIW